MTTRKNSKQSRARAARVALTPEAQHVLVDRLRRMADDVGMLQSEIAAVEALISDGAVSSEPVADVGWTPSPGPQPWLQSA